MKIKSLNKVIESFDIPKNIASMIKTSMRDNMCSYIEAESVNGYRAVAEHTCEWLAIYNKKFRDTQRMSSYRDDIHIPNGSYIFKIQRYDKYTYCYLAINDARTDADDKITLIKNRTIQIYLIGGNHEFFRKLYKKYIDYKLFYDKKETITINNTSNMSSIEVPKKSFDTIFFDDKRKLDNALRAFMRPETKELHTELGIFHKLGILLYGPGGTGKTSIARAVASQLNTDVFILDERNINDFDKKISRTIKQYRNKPVVMLIEDIDCIIPVDRKYDSGDKADHTERTDRLIFQKLLQILDGVNSVGNVIFIATTNAPLDNLDEALKRKGRFSEVYKVDLFDNINRVLQMCHMIKINESNERYIIEKYTKLLESGERIVPADLQDELLSIKEEEFKNSCKK